MTTTFPYVHNIDRRQVFDLVVSAEALRRFKRHDHSHLFGNGVRVDSNGMVKLQDLARYARSVADLIYPLWIAEFPKGIVDAHVGKRYDLPYGRATLCFWLAECAHRQSCNVALPYYRCGQWLYSYRYGVSAVLNDVHKYGRLGLSRASMAGRGYDLTNPPEYNQQELEKAQKIWRERRIHPPSVYNAELMVEFTIQHWDLVENAFRVFPPFLLAFQVAMVIWEDLPPENIYRHIEAYEMPYDVHFPRTGGLFSREDKGWLIYPTPEQDRSGYL
jgi:hypothetical protein